MVTRYGGIGDVICLLPAVVRLKEEHPACALILITSPACAPLVELSGIADLVLPSFMRGLRWLVGLLHPTLNLSPALPDEASPPQPRARVHLIQEFARSLGVDTSSLVHPIIRPAPEHIAQARAQLTAAALTDMPFAVIHTGPTWPVKQWPQAHWTRLVEQLKSTQIAIIQIGATGHDLDAAATMPPVPGAHDWTNQLTLPQTLALLGMARLFIGIDSGLLHLASAAGTPLIGLFGPTDATCFLPRRSDAIGLAATVDCLGCHHAATGPQHWRTGCPHGVRCMSSLAPEMVFEAAQSLVVSA